MPRRPRIRKRKNTEAAERWTKELAKHGFTQIVTPFLAFYPLLNITPSEALLLINLMSYKWGPEHPYPSNKSLANRLGLSDNRRIRQMTSSLEKKGLLLRCSRSRKDNSRTSNAYDLSPLFVKLEHLLGTDEGQRLLNQVNGENK